ncbi:mast cell protease 1A-like isoform X1 [Mauremys mutica]|uniref:mast cell protease 1A-like isoform X1 n=1 Tax=Mauremys mutica TaxID=74926 RepID=UPI001D15F1E2|nr:mast cell protease 1A-like isoform X1 [Mauremys mutica]
MQIQILLLLPIAFLLPSGTWAGEIIGGREAKPHSRRYMAYLEIQRGVNRSLCGGFLVKTNFVLTAAHCNGDKITVKLGAHNISEQERSQQKIPVHHRIPHPQYDKKTLNNDIMLLQGDSGGPLVCEGVAQGIASYVDEHLWEPSVFTKLSTFIPWIQKILQKQN